MKLIGKLKDKVDKANNKEEARNIIKEAGMELTMDELEIVAGGCVLHVGADQKMSRYHDL